MSFILRYRLNKKKSGNITKKLKGKRFEKTLIIHWKYLEETCWCTYIHIFSMLSQTLQPECILHDAYVFT